MYRTPTGMFKFGQLHYYVFVSSWIRMYSVYASVTMHNKLRVLIETR